MRTAVQATLDEAIFYIVLSLVVHEQESMGDTEEETVAKVERNGGQE